MSIAGPLVALNTIVADSLDVIATELESALAEGADFNDAVQSVLQDLLTEHGSVVFNGDGYSEEWQVEAAARGLPNLRNKATLEALVPFTNVIPTFTVSWFAARLLNLGGTPWPYEAPYYDERPPRALPRHRPTIIDMEDPRHRS